VQDLSTKEMHIRVHCKLGNVTSTFVKTIVEAISTRIHFKCSTVNDMGTVEVHSIDDLLMRSYTMWLEAWRAKLNQDLVGLNNRLHRLNVIQVIRDCYASNMTSVSEIVAVFKKEQLLGKYAGFHEEEIYETANKGSIKQLIETKLDITAVQTEINSLSGKINNLDKDAVDYIGGLKSVTLT